MTDLRRPTLAPGSTVFVLVSFEGPDRYASTGGLGVRMTGLARALAEAGHETHHYFLGDPALPGRETMVGGRLVLHRWAQWLSAGHPGGAYNGEERKRRELVASLPAHLIGAHLAPAIAAGKVPIVLTEEWQTAELACTLSDLLHEAGLRERVLLQWNANNPYGFERLNWGRLAFTNRITAVSRYMRSIVRTWGVDCAVLPNGIPERLLAPVGDERPAAFRQALPPSQLFFKMARWEHEKGWAPTLDAMRQLRAGGQPVTLLARSGGTTGRGGGLAHDAAARGLRVAEVEARGGHDEQLHQLALAARAADVVSLRFAVDESLARTLYAASDGVLANSLYEPFGLVGLEAMAAGAVVYTGGTGEDYARHGWNAVVLDTLDPHELAQRSRAIARRPARAARLRRAALRTAARYTWPSVVQLLLRHLSVQARRQQLIS